MYFEEVLIKFSFISTNQFSNFMFMRFVWFSCTSFVYSKWETDKEMVVKADPELIWVFNYKRKLNFNNFLFYKKNYAGSFIVNTQFEIYS